MTDVPVTIHTTPNCVQCMQTKRVLDKEGIAYEVIDLSERPDLVQKFKDEHGFTSAPIVTTDTKAWSGFRLDKLQSLVRHVRSLKAHDQ